MKTSKDTLLMSTLVASMITLATAGAIGMVLDSADAGAVASAAGVQAAVRPATTEVPSVVVARPSATRQG